MHVAVMSHLVPGIGDRGYHVGPVIGGMPGHIERRGHVVLPEQVEHPPDATLRPEPPHRAHAEPPLVLWPLPQPGRLTVDIKSQRHRRVSAGGPVSKTSQFGHEPIFADRSAEAGHPGLRPTMWACPNSATPTCCRSARMPRSTAW